MTQQLDFGGHWTQRKLDALGKYLRAYTTIFRANPRAQYYTTTYVDAFAGTGSVSAPEVGTLIREMEDRIEEYRKGSVRRALEVEPPFDKYLFVEKDEGKCKELRSVAMEHASRNIQIVNDDANTALLRWCISIDTDRERAVVFLDPFGASVEWRVIAALGRTHAVDLWVLFPYSAVNRMLIRDRKPPQAWSDRLTRVFGTADWEREFYASFAYQSIFDPAEQIEGAYKSADYKKISDFFVARLLTEFVAVSEPLALLNSNGALLFLFYFAAGNAKGAKTGLRIANDIVGK